MKKTPIVTLALVCALFIALGLFACKKPAVIEVESVTLDRTSATLEVGGTVTLTATVSPENAQNKEVSWSVSPEGVVSVSGGVVTALSEGEATVTATAGDISANCTVTVNAKVIAVERVELSETSLDLYVGDDSVPLTATVFPDDATDKSVEWSVTPDNVVEVDGGRIYPMGVGTATVTATAGGKSASCVVTVSVHVIPVTNLYLTTNEMTVRESEVGHIKAFVEPEEANEEIVWTVKPAGIITLGDDGTITPITVGEATITATAGEFTDSCVVTVRPDHVPVTSVKFKEEQYTVEIGSYFFPTVITEPVDADFEPEWSVTPDNIVRLENGKVTGLSAGVATVTITLDGISAQCTVTVPDPNAITTDTWMSNFEQTIANFELTVRSYTNSPQSTVGKSNTATRKYVYEGDKILVTEVYDDAGQDKAFAKDRVAVKIPSSFNYKYWERNKGKSWPDYPTFLDSKKALFTDKTLPYELHQGLDYMTCIMRSMSCFEFSDGVFTCGTLDYRNAYSYYKTMYDVKVRFEDGKLAEVTFRNEVNMNETIFREYTVTAFGDVSVELPAETPKMERDAWKAAFEKLKENFTLEYYYRNELNERLKFDGKKYEYDYSATSQKVNERKYVTDEDGIYYVYGLTSVGSWQRKETEYNNVSVIKFTGVFSDLDNIRADYEYFVVKDGKYVAEYVPCGSGSSAPFPSIEITFNDDGEIATFEYVMSRAIDLNNKADMKHVITGIGTTSVTLPEV